MMREGVEQEITWGQYVIGDDIPGLNRQMISYYIRYLGNLRWTSLGYPALYPGFESEPESRWCRAYSCSSGSGRTPETPEWTGRD